MQRLGFSNTLNLFKNVHTLAAEPLVIAIRADSNIKGLRKGHTVDKIGLYADDTILYLADQGPSLQAALEIIEKMGSYSGLHPYLT